MACQLTPNAGTTTAASRDHGRVAGLQVDVQHIAKRYGAAIALDDVSVIVEPSSIHGLVGENGAGKSTLGKIIAGAVAPDDGQVLVDGRPVSYRAPRDAIRDGIAIIDQELALAPAMTVLDNVFLGVERGSLGSRRPKRCSATCSRRPRSGSASTTIRRCAPARSASPTSRRSRSSERSSGTHA